MYNLSYSEAALFKNIILVLQVFAQLKFAHQGPRQFCNILARAAGLLNFQRTNLTHKISFWLHSQFSSIGITQWPKKLYKSPMMIYNLWSKSLDTQLKLPTNQNSINSPKVV